MKWFSSLQRDTGIILQTKVNNMAEEIETNIWGKHFVKDSKGRNWNLDSNGFPIRDREQAREMELLVLYGGPEVGMMTNPDRGHSTYIPT